jgi:hypothetical protein
VNPLRSRKADIEDMIWEVDDDCDKHVTWAEFQAMFSRCRNDKTGAPSRKTALGCALASFPALTG